eukprot:ANDGO_06409.mRNA.1 Ribonucleoside-diphosphate reductase large subunit
MSSSLVTKRDGSSVPFDREVLRSRIVPLCDGLDLTWVSIDLILDKVASGAPSLVTTTKIDELLAETAAYLTPQHPDYSVLAGRIAVTALHKTTPSKFSETTTLLRNYVNPQTGTPAPLVSQELFEYVLEHKDVLDEAVDDSRDLGYDFFGFKTLEKSYLLRIDGRVAERPQHLLMRVACGLNLSSSVSEVLSTYDMLSRRLYTHATPTLFNAGTPRPQLSSCFLVTMSDDSIVGIYDTLKECAMISKYAGGIGLSVHPIRAKGSYIAGTNGVSNGLVPMLRVFNDTARYVDQCFPGDTKVITENGPVEIRTLKVGDRVMTHTGEYCHVNRVLEHAPSSDSPRSMRRITVKHAIEPVEVTDEHQFFVLKDPGLSANYDAIHILLEQGTVQPEWLDAKDLHVGDFVCFPVDKAHVDVAWSAEDCRFYGIMSAGGWSDEASNETRIFLDVSRGYAVRDFVVQYLQLKGIEVHESEKLGSLVIMFQRTEKIPADRELLYNNFREKIFHKTMLRLPLDKTLAVLRGVVESDGCVGEKAVAIEMTSRVFVDSIRFMLMRHGILTSGYLRDRIEKRFENGLARTGVLHCICVPRTEVVARALGISTGEWVNCVRHGDYAFSRIENVEITAEEGRNQPLYDLEVAKNMTYVILCSGIVHNGGGRRKGSFAVYLEPWHADIFDFLDLKKGTGKEEMRARDLFYAMWIPDLFMKRVEANATWSLFCPHECPGLYESWGSTFETLYEKYEAAGKARRVVKAQELWFAILESQMETGTPYMLYKDAANAKSNQQNLGTIRSSNLCTEIIQYSSSEETAVCNLASIALPRFVSQIKNESEELSFDFEQLYNVTRLVVRNLNRVIDVNYYPVEKASRSNFRHRPVGLGVQGLADVFMLLKMPFESEVARNLNREIFECLYFAALSESCALAEQSGPYETYPGSPVSKGILQFDMWAKDRVVLSGRWDWDGLRQRIHTFGVRNSLLVAPMPTASTSQILGNNECFSGDTPVTLFNGTSVPIHQIRPGQIVAAYSDKAGGMVGAQVTEFLPRGEKDVVCLTFADGRTITCTPDHKFMMTSGEWCEARNIELNGAPVMLAFSGTPDVIGTDENGWSLDTAVGILTTATGRDIALAFARVAGFVRSGGSVQAEKVTAVFEQPLDRDAFVSDVESLGGKATVRINERDCFEVVVSGPLARAIGDLGGAVSGAQGTSTASWPAFVLDPACPVAVRREFLAGLFGGDGWTPVLIGNDNEVKTFSPIRFSQSACMIERESLITAMNQLCVLLAEAGVPGASIINIRDVKNTNGDRPCRCGEHGHVCVRVGFPLGALSQHTFMDKIGIRYSVHKSHRYGVVAAWSRYLAEVSRQQEEVCAAAEATPGPSKPPVSQLHEHRKHNTEELRQFKFNSVMSAEHFLENIGAHGWFASGAEDDDEETNKQHTYALDIRATAAPTMKLQLVDRRPAGKVSVYDINVADLHNFVANGVVVHNCFEPYTSNIYLRRVLAGEFPVVNNHLVRDLIRLNLWSEKMRNSIIASSGSIQNISGIPDSIKEIYKTAWEIKQRIIVDYAADRGCFIDQSQSLNIFMASPNNSKLSSLHFYAWKLGLKTGMYYLRTRPAADAIKFTVDSSVVVSNEVKNADSSNTAENPAAWVCTREEGCTMCSS